MEVPFFYVTLHLKMRSIAKGSRMFERTRGGAEFLKKQPSTAFIAVGFSIKSKPPAGKYLGQQPAVKTSQTVVEFFRRVIANGRRSKPRRGARQPWSDNSIHLPKVHSRSVEAVEMPDLFFLRNQKPLGFLRYTSAGLLPGFGSEP